MHRSAPRRALTRQRSRTVLLFAVLCLALAAPAAAAPLPGAPRASREPVPILLYHHVGPRPAGKVKVDLYVPARDFANQVRALAAAGYHAVTLQRVWDAWHHGASLPSKPIVFTFDDGYHDQAANAVPALRARRWPGVLFLTTSHASALDNDITPAEVRGMIAAGWEINAHTLTHPDLTTLAAPQLQSEVAGSRQAIRQQYGRAANFFAYPYGHTNAGVDSAVSTSGFEAAFTTAYGLGSPFQPRLEVRRIRVDDVDGIAGLQRSLLYAHAGGAAQARGGSALTLATGTAAAFPSLLPAPRMPARSVRPVESLAGFVARYEAAVAALQAGNCAAVSAFNASAGYRLTCDDATRAAYAGFRVTAYAGFGTGAVVDAVDAGAPKGLTAPLALGPHRRYVLAQPAPITRHTSTATRPSTLSPFVTGARLYVAATRARNCNLFFAHALTPHDLSQAGACARQFSVGARNVAELAADRGAALRRLGGTADFQFFALATRPGHYRTIVVGRVGPSYAPYLTTSTRAF